MKAIVIIAAAVCLAASLATAAKPRQKLVQVTGADQCQACLGWGRLETPEKCAYCKGVGSTTKITKTESNCTRCSGSGKARNGKRHGSDDSDNFPCSKCQGTGKKITATKDVTPCPRCSATGWMKKLAPCPTCGGDGSTK